MRIDLEQALHDMASSVHDDATTDRMTDQVRHMVARVRRRRAARRTSQGVVGLGAASALVVAGAQLQHHTGLFRDGQQAATQTGPDGAPFGTCGAEVGALDDGGDGSADTATGGESAPAVTISANVDATGAGRALVEVRADFDPAEFDPATTGEPVAVLARDGVVVAPVGVATQVLESWPAIYGIEQELVSCVDDSPLPAGTYELHVRQELGRADGSVVEVSGGPVALAVGEPEVEAAPEDAEATDPDDADADAADGGAADDATDDGVARDPDEDAAWDAITDILNSEDPGVFPACGARLPEAPTDPLFTMTLREQDGTLQLDRGSVGETRVDLTTSGGRTVRANAAQAGTLAFLVEGVVVGYQMVDPDDLHLIELRDRDAGTLVVRWTTRVCDPGGSGEHLDLALPPGEYTVVGSYDFIVQEVTERDGTTRSVTEPLTVVTPPVRATVR